MTSAVGDADRGTGTGRRASYRVALTFDVEHPDRPTTSGATQRIMEALDAEGVRATMFIQGRWAQAYPRTAEALARAGHLIGNHSQFHARMTMLTRGGLASDVRSAATAIRDATGTAPQPWFRCPFGAMDSGTRVIDGLARLGYRDVGWHVDAKDWAARGARSLGERVTRDIRVHGDGAVVLMHGWPAHTAGALPAVIRTLRDDGAEFVAVDELETLPVGPPWREALQRARRP